MITISAAQILTELIDKYTSPSFGHLPKREIDLLILEAMVKDGRISDSPDIAELITKLRVTRSKARSLLYDRDLRRLDMEQLDQMLKSALRRPLIQKQGDTFVLEIENPYLQDHVKSVLRADGHLTDGSFGSGLVRVNAAALAVLIERSLSDKKLAKRALVAAGAATDKSVKGVLMGALGLLGKKVASEAGEEIASTVGEYLGVLLDGAGDQIQSLWGRVFEKDEPA